MSVEKSSVLKKMEIVQGTERFHEVSELYDNVCDHAIELVKPGMVFVLKDNDLFGACAEVSEYKYLAFVYCTIGTGIYEEETNFKHAGKNDEATIYRLIGEQCLLRTRKKADDIVWNVAQSQWLGLTKQFIPGVDIDIIFKNLIIAETGADSIFGAEEYDPSNSEHQNILKSVTFIYGCGPDLPMKAIYG
jgi:hypothetical protein